MRHLCFCPGPTQLHHLVSEEMERAVRDGDLSRSHRSAWFSDLYMSVKSWLFSLLGVPADYRLFFVSSATEAMERTLQNLVVSESCHFVAGAFGDRFWRTGVELGLQTTAFEAEYGDSFSVDEYEIRPNVELVCVTQNETSAGTQVPCESIHRMVDANREKLVAVDVVSSCPYATLDYSLIDVAFFSVQKCFGLPAGLGVMVVSPRALSVAEENVRRGKGNTGYHSFEQLAKWESQGQTPETPQVLGILLLNRILEEYLCIGIDQIRKDTETKFECINSFAEESELFYPVVESLKYRSRTAYALGFSGDAFALRASLLEQGFEIGAGYLERKSTQSRIANFPMHTVADFDRLTHALKQV